MGETSYRRARQNVHTLRTSRPEGPPADGHGDFEYTPFGAETWRDPFPLYARLRDEEPVHHAPRLGIWVLSRFADVYSAVLDTATFSSAHGISLTNEHEELSLLPTIVMMDPPEHTKYRRLVNRVFSPRKVAELEAAIREFVVKCVGELSDAGTGDLVQSLARPVPCFVVAHYLGVPERERVLFGRWTEAIVQANANGSALGAADALSELYEFFSSLIAHRRKSPGDDLISALLLAGREGAELTAEEILGYAFVLIAGGNDTTTGLIGGTAELLTDRVDAREQLIRNPSLIPGAVDEFLRLTSPVQGLCRVTTAPVVVGGVEIPAHSRVLLCYGAANRDEREFGPYAESLDVTRKVRRMLSFSGGPHFCLGAHAARLQGRVVVEELLRSCPEFAVDAEAGRFADGAFVRRYESLPFEARAA